MVLFCRKKDEGGTPKRIRKVPQYFFLSSELQFVSNTGFIFIFNKSLKIRDKRLPLPDMLYLDLCTVPTDTNILNKYLRYYLTGREMEQREKNGTQREMEQGGSWSREANGTGKQMEQEL